MPTWICPKCGTKYSYCKRDSHPECDCKTKVGKAERVGQSTDDSAKKRFKKRGWEGRKSKKDVKERIENWTNGNTDSKTEETGNEL